MRAAMISLFFALGCSGYDDLALLEIDAIEPPQIEPGATVRVHGGGFPLGRAPEIHLRGSMHRPGHPPQRVEAKLAGHVRSESLVEVPVGDEVFDTLGGRATLDGELRVEFRSADQLRDVFATERVRIDFLPDTAAQLRVEGAREGADEPTYAVGFGLTLSREDLGTVGVRVSDVEPRSLAARQGVRPGDRVVGLDGVNVYSWRDFVPDPTRTESTVLLSREGLRGVHALRWPHEATTPVVDPLTAGVLVLLGLVIGWCSPIGLGVRARLAGAPLSAWLVRSALILGFAALMIWVPTLQWTTLWFLVLGTFAAVSSLATRDGVGASSFAFAIGATLVIMLLTRTASVAEVIAAQSPTVSRWFLFQTPASFLAFGSYLFALGAAAARPRLSAALYGAPASVLGAVLFLGGWPLADSLVALAVVGLKALLLLALAHAIEMRARVAVVSLAAGLGLAWIGFFVDLGAVSPLWSALAIGAVCALAARVVAPPLRRPSAPVPA